MTRFIFARLISAIPTVLVTVALAFFMMRLAPGGPFDSERPVSPAIEANLKAAYHLDDPLYLQFLRYLGGVIQGDFGPSFKYQDLTVGELIMQGLPTSLFLAFTAVFLATGLGITIGLIAAWRQNSATDYTVMTGSMLGIVIPNFVMAPLLTLVFGVYLGWLPVGGWVRGDLGIVKPLYVILPIIALILPKIAYIARLTRASTIEVLRSNFIRTARSKGLSERKVLTRHALKASLLPVVSYLGPSTAGTIISSLVVETIFGIPGIGRYFVQGALNRDYTLVLGVVVLYAVIIILFNLIVDIIYGLLDPKVRFE
ncbi:oligopeptide ABC transporter permease OppB [Lacibacterium aquatile]|uniref:Oligopeptide ABC transporter permease OppB n=1 Tax=Lacibacterium aquatile TaxID=1168082 RepID=A0ABW5DPT1_9PROT